MDQKKTLLLRAEEPFSACDDIGTAARLLAEGGVVAIPTETVYGLAADAFNGDAVAAIFAAKGRPQDNPLIVHISEPEQMSRLAAEVTDTARLLADAFWPGPLTMILPKRQEVLSCVTGGLDTVAIRCPSHPVAREVIRQAGTPLAAPSANRSGSPSPTTFDHVLADMQGRVEAILDGGSCGVGVESTVLDLTCQPPMILRPGGITAEMLREVLGEVAVNHAVYQELERGEKAASPGMKYKHYAPTAEVILIDGDLERFVSLLPADPPAGTYALCFDGEEEAIPLPCLSCGGETDPSAQARELYAALRKLDELGARRAYARMPSKDGMGLAVYNRLIRAAAFRIL
ncbi:MAG: threonylcarbamoyl-AMP synthase [Oscillospiraceae bacterium]|nr:threonylcarbamoyl-AMP synthase [Oscillospiraceae bacterium]MBQ8732285.1 threonylcarbamoyl-AMP synthase [Oscillospiraceae bacterium]